MEQEPPRTLIERFADAGVESVDASETCVIALVCTPDRVLAVMDAVGCGPDEALQVIAMPPGDPDREEWAIGVPAVYHSFVLEQVQELLALRGYASRQEVLDMIEARSIGDAR